MTKAALALMLYAYYPSSSWVQSNPPEAWLFEGNAEPEKTAAFFGEPSAYNEWVDLYWSTHGPVYDYDEWKQSR